jgi:hypothetical protein
MPTTSHVTVAAHTLEATRIAKLRPLHDRNGNLSSPTMASLSSWKAAEPFNGSLMINEPHRSAIISSRTGSLASITSCRLTNSSRCSGSSENVSWKHRLYSNLRHKARQVGVGIEVAGLEMGSFGVVAAGEVVSSFSSILVTFSLREGGTRSYLYFGDAANAILAGEDPAHFAGQKVGDTGEDADGGSIASVAEDIAEVE